MDRKTKRRPELVVKAIADPKTRAKLARKRLKRLPLTWREWAMLGVLGMCAVAVLSSFAVKASFHPEEDAEKAMERLAKAYYTEYLYPQVWAAEGGTEEAIEQYKDTGFPLVYLRQMLVFNDRKYADQKQYFANKYYECDENSSRVYFLPVAPYGAEDFTLKITLDCERK